MNKTLEAKADGGMSRFERAAEAVDTFVSSPLFFAGVIVGLAVWTIFLPFQGWANNTWHLALNSPTTSLAVILLALQTNSSRRNQNAQNLKLNAMADALADLIEAMASQADTDDVQREMTEDARKLRGAVGVEEEMSA